MHQPSSPRILLAPTSPFIFKKEELTVAPNLVATVRGADTERRGEGGLCQFSLAAVAPGQLR